jgi:hypothetical protein
MEANDMSDSERHLLVLAQGGSVSAFEELTEPYRVRIYNFMLKTCGDEFEASLLSQDVFVRVFEALISGDFSGGLAYGIYRTAEEISRRASCKSKMIS